MAIPAKSRDWKGILISLVVIASVLGLIQVSQAQSLVLSHDPSLQITIELATPPPGPPRLPSRRMEYSQLLSGEFKPNTFNATWVTGIHMDS